MKNNKVIKDIFIVALSNIIIALAGVVNGFIIPKVMSVTDYGFYKSSHYMLPILRCFILVL